jgi:hypothetical protein
MSMWGDSFFVGGKEEAGIEESIKYMGTPSE